MQHSYVQNQGEFKARSGITVRESESGELFVGKLQGYLSRDAAFAVEEYLLAKRDAELGRWRVPQDPHLVVYENPAGVAFVFDEKAGDYRSFTRDQAFATDGLMYRRAARAYFEAHPERKQLPDENGVYVPAGVDLGSGPLTFVLYNGAWRTTPESGAAGELARIWHEKAGLVRLGKPEDAS